jgi:Holliday junction resolvase
MTGGAAPKHRGSAFEREVVEVLRANGHPYAKRAYGAGKPKDTGDIDGVRGYAIECKAHRAMALAAWMDEAIAEAANAGPGVVPVVVAKRRGKPTSEAYVILRLADFGLLAR